MCAHGRPISYWSPPKVNIDELLGFTSSAPNGSVMPRVVAPSLARTAGPERSWP